MTAPEQDAAGRTCAVCGEVEPDAALLALCFDCQRPFHLNPYNNRPGKDCGDAWIGDQMGVETYCQECIDRAQAEATGLDAPGATPPAPAPPSGAPPSTTPPPRRRRETRPRRFRRIDRP